MKTHPDEQAFPCLSTTVEDRNGLTKREYFAAMALQGLLACQKRFFLLDVTKTAVKIADYLVESLNKDELPSESEEESND